MNDEKIYRTSVVTEAMYRIKNMISSEKYQIGDRIPTETELAERFGIGRSSIREAIKVFQYLGILEARVPKGTFVCEASNIAAEFLTWFALLSQKDIDEILEIREVFEQKGVYNIINNLENNSELADTAFIQLEQELERMEDAISKKDYEEIFLADFNFHKILIKETGNTLFYSIYEVLHGFIHEEMHETHVSYTNLNQLLEQHKNIINAIKTGDHKLAIDAHAEHFPLIRSNLQK